MHMEKAELPGGLTRVKLNGALDIAGAAEIDLPFNVVASSSKKVMIDFTGVTFLASIGIRVLMKAARAISNKQGKLVVYKPSEDARKVLRSTGIDTIIPVVADEQAAIAELSK